MANVIFNYQGLETKIQCNKEDKMKDICNNFANKTGLDINLIYFLYDGKILNLELTFNQLKNLYAKDKNEMKILVQKFKSTLIINDTESKEIICSECKENCKIQISDYKIKLYDCKNNHEINNILLDEYKNTQNINESNIICNICNKQNKNKTYEKRFYICLICKKNICPLCSSIHDKNHKIIDYDRKNYICLNHNELYISYCNKCKINLCSKCELEHNNHEIIKYINILPDENQIKEELKEFRNKINKLNDKMNNIINILNKIKENIELYYKINNNIITNYKKENINYEILYNINEIKNNIKIKDIDEIIKDNNINNEFKNLLNIYYKMTNKNNYNRNISLIYDGKKRFEDKNKSRNNNKDKEINKIKNKNNDNEITIIYKINKNDTKIKIFDIDFINNNKNKCKYIYKDKEFELEEYFNLSNYDKDEDELEIGLKGINNITDMSSMFKFCSSLLSLPDISKWNTNKVTNMSSMFNFCLSLSLPDISKWNTNNVKDMNSMFQYCSSLSSLPDISKWNTNKVINMNSMFGFCLSLESLPDISKWNTINVKDMSCMFQYCSSLSSLPDINKWNINNVKDMSFMFNGCKDSLNIPKKFK